MDADVSDAESTCWPAALHGGEHRVTRGALSMGQGTAPASPALLLGLGLWSDSKEELSCSGHGNRATPILPSLARLISSPNWCKSLSY